MGTGIEFEWGRHDCAHHMAKAIRARHAEHPILHYLHEYEDEQSAKALLKRIGGLCTLLATHFEEISPLSARDGDIGVISAKGLEAGCVVRNGRAVGLAPFGEFILPVSRLTKAYRV
ncbi:DUF6950 family protein [Maritalea myrionectae]|uniref:DUF6950 family protein n=1 Tax=Maritalea myrionectae TaxID=454601 RepID=UPI0003F6DEC2|nr:hypothetical protein [Maritalea myrionectae]